ncbi:MAG: hypothetical protein H9W81_13565 [Enterococcus sp.]|nr:hypothetical protein [Enterococcus sp.]
MSKSLIFRFVLIALVWVLMVHAGFGLLMTLFAVFVTFLFVNIFVLGFRLVTGVAGRFRR